MIRPILAAVASAAALFTSLGSPAVATTTHFDHAYVIMMENQSFDNLVGRNAVDPVTGNILAPDTPFITALAGAAGLATLYFGVTHPSLPNYLATIGGDFYGVQDDNASCFAVPAPGPGCHHTTAPNLIDELEAKGLTWTALEESMPSAGYLGTQYPGSSPRLYAQKHNPFVYFDDIARNPNRLAKIQPLTANTLGATLAQPPSLTYIVPNQCNDMHGTSTCTQFDALLRQGDKYLQNLVTQIQSSKSFTANSAIFIIWDEDDYSSNFGCCSSPRNLGGGHTLALVVSAGSRMKRSATPMNHYSLLRTLEVGYGLPLLGHSADPGVATMFELL